MAVLPKKGFQYREFSLNVYSKYKDKQSTKMFLELILSISTLIIFALFALRPTILTIIELVKQIQAKEELITLMDSKIEDLSRAQSNYYTYQSGIQSLSQAIPTGAKPDDVIYQLQGVVLQNSAAPDGTSVQNVQILGQNKGFQPIIIESVPGTGNYSLVVDTTANYTSLEQTLADILRMRTPILIETLSLSKAPLSEDQEDTEILSLNISGKTVYFNKPEQPDDTGQTP